MITHIGFVGMSTFVSVNEYVDNYVVPLNIFMCVKPRAGKSRSM